MTRWSFIGWMGSAVLFLPGCSAPPRTVTHVGSQNVFEADRAAVFDAAEIALVNAGFEIDRRSFADGVLTTKPLEAQRDAERAGGVRISSRVPLRRIAEVRIRQEGAKVATDCKVLIQEQTTRTHRLFSGRQSANDTISDTPIDRDAATTASQYAVWKTLRRDRPTERAILKGISDHTGH